MKHTEVFHSLADRITKRESISTVGLFLHCVLLTMPRFVEEDEHCAKLASLFGPLSRW